MNKIFLAIILGMCLVSFASALTNSGLKAYWSFNETSGTNVDDSAGHKNNGTTINSPVWNLGQVGNGLQFLNTSSQYVNFTTNPLFNNNTQTIAFWAKPSFGYASVGNYYFYDSGNPSPYQYVMSYQGGSPSTILQILAGGTPIIVLSSANLATWWHNNTWMNFVVTMDSTGDNRLYVDGVLINSTTVTWTKSNPAFFRIGATSALDAGYYFNGTIDELSIWNRTLSAADALELNTSITYANFTTPFVNIVTSTAPSTDYETSTMTNGRFFVNVSNSTYINLTATFIYNGTIFSTLWSSSTGFYTFETNITKTFINETDISYSWNFTITNSTGTYSRTDGNGIQIINPAVLTICNSTYSVPYINFTFKDETSLALINATIPAATFEYWLGSNSSINKTLSYSNTSLNYNYTFCFSPNTRNVTIDYTLQYASTDYPQRIYNPSAVNFSNATTSQILYLLNTADGIYVTFQVSNAAGQILNGVNVNATRSISGSDILVGQGITDSAGAVTFWLNPNFGHSIYFSKTGYDTLLLSIYPTQTSYTVTLGGATTAATSDYTRGLSYYLSPGQDFLDENNKYNFSYTISSTYWALDSFGFSLYWGNNTLIGSNISTTATGGTLYLFNINVTNASSVYLTYNYTIEGNTTSRSGRTWIIVLAEGGEFSITRFFNDLSLYIGAGFFGFDDFGRILISLVVIILVGGGLAYNYGLRSEAAVMGIIFGIVFFLDVGIGFIPRISVGGIQATSHFATIITFLILLGFVIKEQRQ
jgi:hypothetical protein